MYEKYFDEDIVKLAKVDPQSVLQELSENLGDILRAKIAALKVSSNQLPNAWNPMEFKWKISLYRKYYSGNQICSQECLRDGKSTSKCNLWWFLNYLKTNRLTFHPDFVKTLDHFLVSYFIHVSRSRKINYSHLKFRNVCVDSSILESCNLLSSNLSLSSLVFCWEMHLFFLRNTHLHFHWRAKHAS